LCGALKNEVYRMEWIKIGGALLAGLVCGFVFVMLKLPIPAPPTLAGIMGIVGVFGGYLIGGLIR
jgi:XapX domain-containing protein